jgi:hypothetical protein
MIFKILFIAAFASIGAGLTFVLPWVKKDNPIEEACEQIIKNETGIDVDLTPESQETENQKKEDIEKNK